VTEKVFNLNRNQFLSLLTGDKGLKGRLAAGERMRVETPFIYPGRLGPVMVYLGPRPAPDPTPEPVPQGDPEEIALETVDLADMVVATPPVPPLPPPPGAIRISDGGLLVKMLSQQGMELEVDMIMSKTVFHAVRQQDGAGLKGSEVYLDSTAQMVDVDLWRFLQVVAEVIGLRHGKYKDALIQLEKRKDADAGVLGWRPT
jgi:hypothetical protein